MGTVSAIRDRKAFDYKTALAEYKERTTDAQKLAFISNATDGKCDKSMIDQLLCEYFRLDLDPNSHCIVGNVRNSKVNGVDKPKLAWTMTVEGMLMLADRSGQYAGMEDGPIEFEADGKTVRSATVTVYRTGFQRGFTATILYREAVQLWNGSPTGVWRTRPGGMTQKCARAQAMRLAFPAILGGIFLDQEAAIDGVFEVRDSVAPTPALPVLMTTAPMADAQGPDHGGNHPTPAGNPGGGGSPGGANPGVSPDQGPPAETQPEPKSQTGDLLAYVDAILPSDQQAGEMASHNDGDMASQRDGESVNTASSPANQQDGEPAQWQDGERREALTPFAGVVSGSNEALRIKQIYASMAVDPRKTKYAGHRIAIAAVAAAIGAPGEPPEWGRFTLAQLDAYLDLVNKPETPEQTTVPLAAAPPVRRGGRPAQNPHEMLPTQRKMFGHIIDDGYAGVIAQMAARHTKDRTSVWEDLNREEAGKVLQDVNRYVHAQNQRQAAVPA